MHVTYYSLFRLTKCATITVTMICGPQICGIIGQIKSKCSRLSKPTRSFNMCLFHKHLARSLKIWIYAFQIKYRWSLPSWHAIPKQNANTLAPLWSEISVLAGAKCQPAQTDGVKSRAERVTLADQRIGVEGNMRHPFVCFVRCEHQKSWALLPRWQGGVTSGLFALQVIWGLRGMLKGSYDRSTSG